MKNMKIGPKLILSFVIVTIISSIAGLVSLALLYSADVDYSEALNNYGFSQGDVGLLMSTINDNCTNIMSIFATDNPSDIPALEQKIQTNIENISTYMKAVEGTLEGGKERACYDTIAANLPEFSEHATAAIKLAKSGLPAQGYALYNREALEHIQIIQQKTQELMTLNKDTGSKLSSDLSRSAFMMIFIVAGLITAAMLISIIVAVRVSRGIARPMAACSARIAALAEGDLTSPVPVVRTGDETGVLAKSSAQLVERLQAVISDVTMVLEEIAKGNLAVSYEKEYRGDFAAIGVSIRKILADLNDTMARINQSSDQVASGSGQVSSGAQALSQGATEQASAVQELAATINEISDQVKETATNAVEASRNTQLAGDQIGQCNEQMKRLNAAMADISSSSDQIGKIIKTIDDIAFQTNILALNAAVEAARAGAAGKGFAVVADEVRNLASKSAEAVKDTTVLIENSIKSVENGTKIADETAKSLLGIVEGAEGVQVIVAKISNAANRQADAITQVTQGVEQISAVVQTNSATAQQSAASSEELSGQAQILRELVGRFRLQNGGSVPSAEDSFSGEHDIPGSSLRYSEGGDKY